MRRAVIDGRDGTVVAAMVFEAATLVVVSAVHLVTAGGSKPSGAGIAEAVIAVVLLAGASALARGGPHGHQAALGALAVAIAGFILGLTFTLRGGTLADVLYHLTMLPVLVATVVALRRGAGRRAVQH